ncbi:MAG: hypothetical protein PHP45_02655 [Elusimicrobiales bacterium]|nr:hypothetical protein [Elusimicrobiales bacterium]
MNEVICRLLPVLAALNLSALLLCVWLSRSDIMNALRPAGKKALWFAGALTAIQACVYIFLAGKKHLIYIDEFWYMEAAKNILVKGWAPGYAKAIGWPFLTALAYLLGGISGYSAIGMSILLGMLAPLAEFALGFALTGSFAIAAISAFLLAFFPYAITWAASAETGTASLFFTVLSAFFSALYYKTPNRRLLWLALLSWAMSAQIRPENMILFGLFAAGIFLLSEIKTERKAGFFLPWLCALSLALPNLLIFARFQSSSNWIEIESAGTAHGSNISLSNLWQNTLHWGVKFFDGSLHPTAFTLAALAGAAYLFVKNRKAASWLGLWAALLYVFYFSAWFNTYGSTLELFPKTKLYLFFYPAFCIFAAAGFRLPFLLRQSRRLGWLAVVTGAWLAVGMPRYYRQARIREPKTELETKMLEDIKKIVPDNCVIIANAPVMVKAASFYSTVCTDEFLRLPPVREAPLRSQCPLYLRDITTEFKMMGFDRLDKEMTAGFNLSPYALFSQGGSEYGLYRVSPKPRAGKKPAAPDKLRR